MKQVCTKAVTRYIDNDDLIDIEEWVDCETGYRHRRKI